jgi:hypothetical protein
MNARYMLQVVLLRAKKVGHQISVSFEKFDIVQALLSFFLTLFQLTVYKFILYSYFPFPNALSF